MLIAQAITEPMRFITGDAALQAYSSLVMLI
jgi:PIN domain nuclease of toxin-antitoxin system